MEKNMNEKEIGKTASEWMKLDRVVVGKSSYILHADNQSVDYWYEDKTEPLVKAIEYPFPP